MKTFLNQESGDTVKVEVKQWWTSKTLWLNVITFVLGVVVLAQESALFAGKAELLAVLASANALLNFILRFISNSPLSSK